MVSESEPSMPTEGPQEGPAEGGTRFIEGGSAETEVGTKPRREAPVTATPGTALGRYMVLGTLGAGGMGTVLRAYDESLDRAIAIKLLHSGTAERHAKRLMREAQALARLSHPNVVHVYEVGRASGQWFIAMELVRGQTLRKWQAARHEWRECVKVYQQAGAGLVAAHAAGLVHRDFKPDNCILDEDGRPRVLDFGLVRETDVPSEGEPLAEATAVDTDAQTPLTRAGTVLGTLAYMPLEQFDGKPADARSDQFSFCVSLYEALYGERPFTEATVGRRTLALMKGDVRPPPKGSRVPAKLRRVVLRGLSPDPDHRWPSMEVLLAQLRGLAAPPPRRWLALSGGLALGLGLLGAGLAYRADPPKPTIEHCTGARGQLDGIWDDARRRQVQTAILGTDRPYAPDTWARIEPRLQGYADSWASKHTDVCEATAAQPEKSDTLGLQMTCLQERRTALRAAVDVLASTDDTVVDGALKMVDELPDLDHCDDVRQLEQRHERVPPPDDPKVAQQVEVLRERLADLTAMQDAGQYGSALNQAEHVVKQAEALDYGPLLAEAEVRQGRLLERSGRYAEAERALGRAHSRALRHGYDAVVLDAAQALTFVVGYRLSRPAEGLVWGRTAVSLAEHTGEDTARARSLGGLGLVFLGQEDYERAELYFRQALQLTETALGADHPAVANSLGSLGSVFHGRGQYERARLHHERALRLIIEARGADHPDVGQSSNDLGLVLHAQGRYEQASLHYQRALQIFESKYGTDHPRVAYCLNNLGNVFLRQDEYELARRYYERALRIWEEAGADGLHPTAASLNNLGDVFAGQGDVEQARVHYERALRIWEKVMGTDHPNVSYPLVGLAQIALTERDVETALMHAERAVSIREEGEVAPELMAEARFVLARAQWNNRDMRAPARMLAEQAREALATAEGPGETNIDLADVEAWLAAHRVR